MARLNSFYLTPDTWPSIKGDIIDLVGDEVRHMLIVLRTAPDQVVRLFDGQGRDGLFKVCETSKKRVRLETLELNIHTPDKQGVTLAIGWGKSKRRNYLFEKVVELQGNGVLFWEAKRSQGQLPKAPKETWREKCVQAAKQCGSLFLPKIDTVNDGVQGLCKIAGDFDKCYLAWESDEASEAMSPSHLDGNSLIVIGPEGGFEKVEAEKLISAGFTPVTLGKSILRWETAASYCLSLGWFAKQD